MAVTGIGTYASYTNSYGNTQNAGNKTGRTYKNAHEYKNYFPAMKMNLRQWSSCKEMVFVCVIWSFDDMGLGEQVILSDKGNRETEQIINIGKVIIFWNRDGRMFYVKDYR